MIISLIFIFNILIFSLQALAFLIKFYNISFFLIGLYFKLIFRLVYITCIFTGILNSSKIPRFLNLVTICPLIGIHFNYFLQILIVLSTFRLYFCLFQSAIFHILLDQHFRFHYLIISLHFAYFLKYAQIQPRPYLAFNQNALSDHNNCYRLNFCQINPYFHHLINLILLLILLLLPLLLDFIFHFHFQN
jgi:hypothetical protein